MRPLVYSQSTPRDIAEFSIHWRDLVGPIEPLTNLPFLLAIQQYTNNSLPSGGVFAYSFEYRADAEFERLLSVVHGVSPLQSEAVPYLLARSHAATILVDFAKDPAILEQSLRSAAFKMINPFLLQGSLADYLFRYGMYSYYYQEHTANDAWNASREFLDTTVGLDLEAIVAFESSIAWGEWFDPHSCTDKTFLLLNRKTQRFWLCAFSHSD
jgi:hypothetical protein